MITIAVSTLKTLTLSSINKKWNSNKHKTPAIKSRSINYKSFSVFIMLIIR